MNKLKLGLLLAAISLLGIAAQPHQPRQHDVVVIQGNSLWIWASQSSSNAPVIEPGVSTAQAYADLLDAGFEPKAHALDTYVQVIFVRKQ